MTSTLWNPYLNPQYWLSGYLHLGVLKPHVRSKGVDLTGKPRTLRTLTAGTCCIQSEIFLTTREVAPWWLLKEYKFKTLWLWHWIFLKNFVVLLLFFTNDHTSIFISLVVVASKHVNLMTALYHYVCLFLISWFVFIIGKNYWFNWRSTYSVWFIQ